MADREQIAERLKRFEALCGISYEKAVAEIWLEHLKDEKADKFNRICSKIEQEVKWHIQPTLGDYYGTVKKNTKYY